MADKILLYSDTSYRWAGTFFGCPIEYKKMLFTCTEQWLRWKSVKGKIKEELAAANSFKAILYLSSAHGAEKVGGELIEHSEKKRFKLQLKAQRMKYKQNPMLAQLLVDTADAELIYDGKFEDFFGTGKEGKGQDKLGKILTRVRGELKEGKLKPIRFKV